MASFKLTSPDGTSYRVDAPDEQSAYSAFQKMEGGGQVPAGQPDQGAMDAMDEAAPQHEDPGIVSAILNKGLQGLTFGFGDELKAGLKTGAGFLGDYGAQVAKERETNEAIDEHHPIIGALSEIVGSLALPGGAAKAGLSLVGRSAAKAAAKGVAAKAAGRSIGTLEKVGDAARRVGAGAVEGGLYAGASGAGNAEGGLEERAQGAADAVPLGVGIGSAASAISPALGRVAKYAPQIAGGVAGGAAGYGAGLTGNPLYDTVGGATLGATGGKFVRGLIRNRGSNVVNEASRRIGEALPMKRIEGRTDAPGTAIADVAGPQGEDLLRTSATQSGERGPIATRASVDNMSAVDRVRRAVQDGLHATEGGYELAKAEIRDARANAATPFYDRFYAQKVEPSEELSSILNTRSGRAGLAAAKGNASDRREPWAEFFEHVDDNGNILDKAVPNARALDEVRRVVKGLSEQAKTNPDGSPFAKALANPESRSRDKLLKDLDAFMETVGPRVRAPDGKLKSTYQIARDVGGENISLDDAIEFGRKALSTDARVLANKMDPTVKGSFTPEQRRMAITGLADDLFKKLSNVASGGASLDTLKTPLDIFKTPGVRDKLRAMFPTNAEFNTFQRTLMNEARRANTNRIAEGATGKARVIKEGEDAAGVSGVGRTFGTFGLTAALWQTAKNAAARVGGLTPKMANEVGKQLMERRPEEVKKIVQRIHMIEKSKLSRAARGANVRAVLAAGAAQGAGRGDYRGVE